jgi:predicted nuclease with TOPRIM domain
MGNPKKDKTSKQEIYMLRRKRQALVKENWRLTDKLKIAQSKYDKLKDRKNEIVMNLNRIDRELGEFL